MLYLESCRTVSLTLWLGRLVGQRGASLRRGGHLLSELLLLDIGGDPAGRGIHLEETWGPKLHVGQHCRR